MGKKILVIEDDPGVRENISEILTEEGYGVLQAENGKSGYQAAVHNLPDIIICDILMPEMNGYEVIHYLKQNPITSDIPFLFLSAKADIIDIRKGMQTGADDYITKPFSVKDLLNAVNLRMEKHEHSSNKLKGLTRSLETSIPYELRTRLTGILGFSRLMADNPQTYSYSEIKEFSEGIYSAGKRLHRLIANFLYLAKIELLSVSPDKIALLRKERLGKTASILKQSAAEKAKEHDRAQDLKMDVSENEVTISLESFIKMTDEILDNAFRFSDKGNIVSVISREDKEHVILSVANEGSRMSDKQIEDLMPHGRQEIGSRKHQGSGLGLSIAIKIAELYGGKITIGSSDKKIQFDIYLLKS